MTRILAAALGLTLALVLPAVAHAQVSPGAPLLAYQSNDQRFTLSAGAWFGHGNWRFTGPVEVKANNTLIMLDLRYRLNPLWTLALDYAGGSWTNITFNSAPAPASVSGKVSLFSFDVRRRLDAGTIPIDLLLGWQVYRARTDDSSVPSSDEARAGGLRLGAEAWVPLRGMWSARVLFAYAPSMSVTEEFISGGTTTTTYNGSLTDIQVAIRYDTGNRFAAEAGWRAQRIDFRRPTDILEHTLDGIFLHVIVRP